MAKFTEEQLEERRKSIGASEVAAVLGLNPYCSMHEVWLSKMALADFEGNDATEAGDDFEETILRRLARHNGVDLAPSRTFVGPESFITATPDAIIIGGGIAEAKMVGYESAWMWGTGRDEIPYPYLCQVQQQLLCSGEPFCIVGAQMGTRHRYYRIESDVELQRMIVERLRAFWTRYVITKTPPPVDGSDGAREMLKKLHPSSDAPARPANEYEVQLAGQIVLAREIVDRETEALAKLENKMRESMGGCERITGDGWRARWKTSKNGQRPFVFEPAKELKA